MKKRKIILKPYHFTIQDIGDGKMRMTLNGQTKNRNDYEIEIDFPDTWSQYFHREFLRVLNEKRTKLFNLWKTFSGAV